MKKVHNRGFSLMESVIAILLVGIIMTAVLSTVLYTNSVTKKAETKLYAINEIDNIITCVKAKDYKYYDDEKFVDNQELKFSKDFQLFDSDDYFYKIKLSVTKNSFEDITSIRAIAYNKDDKIIYAMDNPYILGGS